MIYFENWDTLMAYTGGVLGRGTIFFALLIYIWCEQVMNNEKITTNDNKIGLYFEIETP